VQILRKAEQLLQAEGDLLLADLNLEERRTAAAEWGKKRGGGWSVFGNLNGWRGDRGGEKCGY